MERSRAALFRDGAGACIEGTPGAKLVEGLEVREGDRIVVKRRFSAFFGTNLDLILRCSRLPCSARLTSPWLIIQPGPIPTQAGATEYPEADGC